MIGNGNLIGKLNAPSTSVAGGMWGMDRAGQARFTDVWPRLWSDPANKFNNVGTPNDIQPWLSTAPALGCTLTRDTTVTTPIGGVPLRMVTNGTVDPQAATYNNSGGFNGNIAAVSLGEVWQARVITRANLASTSNGQLFIFEVNSSGTWSGTGDLDSTQISFTTDWVEWTVTRTITNPLSAYVQIRLDGPQDGQVRTI